MNDDDKTVNTGGEIKSFLPLAAVRMLQDAANTPLDMDSLDPELDRRLAVDKAHSDVRHKWPSLFRK